ncbi:MAG TPA: ATP-binding protein [Kofleriaceae bacterium]|nr:ATP-binding protein [Kofleriaceae bacterium]
MNGRIARYWPGVVAASRSRCKAIGFVASDSPVADVVRRLPAAAVVSVALAVLYRAADGATDASVSVLWLIAGGAGALLAVLGWSAMAHARSEMRRRAAERQIAERDAYIAGERSRLHEQLEGRVDERIAELQAINEQLEAFSYSVAHDLRAPLRSIATFSQALQDDHAEQLDPGGLEYLTHIHRASQRMGHLIDDLLNFSRVTRTQLRRERVDLSLLARAVIGRLRFMHPDREVEAVVEDGLTVMADPRALDIVLTNLLGNAWKFTGKGEHARVELAAQPGQPGTYVVRDNGVGFDQAQAGRLFGVFQRLHPAHEFEGTGIGLATVQRLVQRHGGKVWAEGEVGRGASVYFTLGPE